MANTFNITLRNAIKSIIVANYHIAYAIDHPLCDGDTKFELQKLMENNKINKDILKELRNEKVF